MLSQDLFESPSLKDGQLCRSSQANGQELVVPPPPEAHLCEMMMTTMTEGGKALLKNFLYPFPGFGLQESGEQEQQILFLPSPSLPDQGEGEEHDGEGEEHDGEGEESKGGIIVVSVEEEEEEEGTRKRGRRRRERRPGTT
jgi:hypothetical protein